MDYGTISVIVPIYNVEKYLNECIESIVNQTYEKLEIILVDDGSTDNCGRIIDKWATMDTRIIALHKENGGLSDARNYGFAHSTGDYISYIDSDDYIDKTYFEKLLSLLINTNADMAGCRFFRNNVSGEGFRYPKPDESYRFVGGKELFLEHLYNDLSVFCVAWGKLYKRKVIVENMYPIVKICEDAMVIRELAYRCERIAYIPDALYMYRDRPSSIINNKQNYSNDNRRIGLIPIENDIAFYKSVHNDRLQALAEKAYCHAIYNGWNKYNKECKKHYKGKYYNALLHMVFNEGNRLLSKCKYLVFGIRILLD